MYVSGCVGAVSIPNCFHSTLPENHLQELLLEAKMHTHSIVPTILHLKVFKLRTALAILKVYGALFQDQVI